MNWECTKCKKITGKVNTTHVQYPTWVKKGLKSFCFKCMKNTKQIVKSS